MFVFIPLGDVDKFCSVLSVSAAGGAQSFWILSIRVTIKFVLINQVQKHKAKYWNKFIWRWQNRDRRKREVKGDSEKPSWLNCHSQ